MSVISSSDRSLIANAKRVTVEAVLNLVPLTEIASATISAPSAVYPAIGFNVTGTSANWGDITPGMLWRIERPDGVVVAYGVVRLPVVPSAIYTDPKSRGDGGYARDIYYEVEGGETIRVYDVYPPFGVFSRATGEAVFKYWDVAYRGSGSRPDPVVNLGTHQQAYIDALTGEASFALSAAGSYDWFGGSGNIITYSWDLPAALSVLSGSTSDASLTVSAPPGVYKVACTVTTNTGRIGTGYRYLFANIRGASGTGAAFSEVYGAGLPTSDQQSALGREISITVDGSAKAALYPGAMAVLTTRYYYDGVELEQGATVFVGYLSEVSSSGTLQRRTLELKFLSPLRYGRTIPTYTQLIEEVPIPAEWTEVAFGLSNPAYYGFYALRYHTFLLSVHDYLREEELEDLRRRVIGLSQTNIAGQLQFIGEIMRGVIGNRSDGSFYARRIGDLLENAERNALDEKYTWTDAELKAPLTLNPRLRPTVSQVIMDGISYNGVDILTYRAIAPGYAAGQGQGVDDAPDVIVTPAEGQDRLERIAGHKYAYENNPLSSVNLALAFPLDILEPADNDWHILNVSAGYVGFDPNQFGVDLTGETRFTPVSITRAWRRVGQAVIVDITAEVRFTSFGQKGEFLPIAKEDGWNWQAPSGWLDGQGERNLYNQDTPDFNLGSGYALAVTWNSGGEAALSESFLDPIPVWESIRGTSADALPGTILDLDWNYAGAATGAYALVQTSETEVKVYRTADILAKTWVEEETFTVGAGFTGKGRVRSSASLAAVALLSTSGISISRKSGVTWNSLVVVASGSYSDSLAGNSELALVVDGTTVYVGGLVDNSRWALFSATGAAGTFSEVPNAPAESERAPGVIAFNSALSTDRYVSLYRSSSSLSSDVISGFPEQQDLLDFPTNSADAPNTLTRYGFHNVRQTAEQRTGTLYTVGALTATFSTSVWYPPGAASAPDYFPPSDFYSADVTLELVLLDDKGRALWGSGLYQWNTLDAGGTITYAPSPMGFTRINYTITQSISPTFSTPIEGVAAVEYRFLTDTAKNFGGGEFLDDGSLYSYFEITGGIGTLTLTEKGFNGWRLFKIDGANAWADITPPDAYVPTLRSSLARSVSSAGLTAIGEGATGIKRLLKSSSSGSAWVNDGTTVYKFLKELDTDIFLAGGQDKLDLTIDDFDTVHSRLGNLSLVIGGIKELEGVLLLVENS